MTLLSSSCKSVFIVIHFITPTRIPDLHDTVVHCDIHDDWTNGCGRVQHESHPYRPQKVNTCVEMQIIVHIKALATSAIQFCTIEEWSLFVSVWVVGIVCVVI